MHHWRRLLPLVLIPFTSVACLGFLDLGGDDDDARQDKDPSLTMPPGENASALKAFCLGRRDYAKRCPSPLADACEDAKTNACEQSFSIYRGEYLLAADRCEHPSVCLSSNAQVPDENCMPVAMDGIAPTTRQRELAVSLCEACGTVGNKNCLDDFFYHGRRSVTTDGSSGTVSTVTVSGAGASFDMLNDAIVQNLQTKCLPEVQKLVSNAGCWSTFYRCIDAELASVAPSSVRKACTPDAPNVPPDNGASVPPTQATTDSGGVPAPSPKDAGPG